MNTATFRKQLLAELSDRSFCIGRNTWCHESGNNYCEFTLSILPGLNGSECQLFIARSLQGLAAQYNALKTTGKVEKE